MADDGALLVGWIVGTAAVAGIYGAITNKNWLSVMKGAVTGKYDATPIDTKSIAAGDWGGTVSGDWGGTTTGGASAPAAVAIGYAQSQIGKPYAWGGSGPDRFDCSGLTMKAFEAAGHKLSHYTGSQLAETIASRIPTTTTPPAGALVFYGVGVPHHVGLSIGGGNMISAPHTGAFVEVESVAGFGADLMAVTDPLGGPKVISPPVHTVSMMV